MQIKINHNTNVVLERKTLEHVENFKYLGIILNNDGDQEVEVKNSIKDAAQFYRSIKNIDRKEFSKKVNMSVHNCVFTYTS